jgi:HJR/Mrr/RecB family endonuclease
MILDYSEHVNQASSFGLNSGKTINRDLYFDKRGICKYCVIEMKRVHSFCDVDTKTIHGVGWHKTEYVYVCEKCGWWEHSYHSQLEGEPEYKDWEAQVNSAILKKFEVDSSTVPITTLQAYIANHPDKIIDIHHKKMEELVASIFSEHYQCEAKLVGKSNDGGVDVVLIKSNKPIIIQVKRRMDLKKTESVAPVRELIGTTLLQDSRDCIFVTTGKRFTKAAKDARDQALTKNLVNSFKLFNRDEFIDVLNLHANTSQRDFSKFFRFITP